MAQAEETALSLFRTDGYEATGLAKLTSAIGISSPSLYSAYGSKAGLFAKTVDLYQKRCAPFFEEAFAADTPEDFVRCLLDGAVRAYTQEGQGRGCLVLDGTRNATDPEALSITETVRAAFREQATAKLTGLGVEDPERIADVCQTMMTGLSGSARHGVSRARLSEIAMIMAKSIA